MDLHHGSLFTNSNVDFTELLLRRFSVKILELLNFQFPNLCSSRDFFSMLPLFVRGLETESFIKNNKSVVYIPYTTDISIYITIRVCVDVLSLFLMYQFCVFYILQIVQMGFIIDCRYIQIYTNMLIPNDFVFYLTARRVNI